MSIFPFYDNKITGIFNFTTQTTLVFLSIIKVFKMEGIHLVDSVLTDSRVMMIPIDSFMFNLFIIIHMTKTEYIGRNSWDYY